MSRCYLCSVNKGELTLECGIHICGSCLNLLPDEAIARVIERALAPLKEEKKEKEAEKLEGEDFTIKKVVSSPETWD